MLIAKSSRMVGAMKIQAMARSERPRTVLATGLGVDLAALSISVPAGRDSSMLSTRENVLQKGPAPPGKGGAQPAPGFREAGSDLALFLEHFLPILDEEVEGLFRGP